MADSFDISFQFAEQYVRFSKPEFLQVYIYLLYYHAKNNILPDAGTIARDLGLTENNAQFILEYWGSRGELIKKDGQYSLPDGKTNNYPASQSLQNRDAERAKPGYTAKEISAVASANPQISHLFKEAEKIYQKPLTPSVFEMLYSFIDWLGLPVEVVLMLLTYAAKHDKLKAKYLTSVAMDWADKEINTYETAESYIKELEAIDSAEHQIRCILGIYDRALTQTEKKYIRRWTEELHSPAELFAIAYPRTVANTGKLSWAYMNKMLEAWADDNIRTSEDLESHDQHYRLQNPVSEKGGTNRKKSRFNNYNDTNTTDYGKLEEQILDMMLDDLT